MSPIGEGRRLPAILIIDDDMVSREVMATVLTLSGYVVHTAQSGAESLQLLDSRTCTPEVILMDTQMPGLSGTALIQELRARSRAALYAMSGSQVPRAVTAGTDGFLLKPFGPEALQRMLETHSQAVELEGDGDAAVLKLELVEQFRQMMPAAGVRQIYTTLVTDLAQRIVQVEAAIDGGDRGAVRRLGHAIKGGCAMTGAEQAARLGGRLESGGDNLEYSRSVAAELRGALERLKDMLKAEFPPQGSGVAD